MGPSDAELLETARRAAREAAKVHTEWGGRLSPGDGDEKGQADFVTETDREAERLVTRILLNRFPDHGILAEEETSDHPGRPGGIRWIVDPLDGTTNWLHGYPEFAVSIAALDARGLRAAVVLNSATGEEFDAVRGGGARRDGKPIHVSATAELRHALIGTGFPFKRHALLPPYLRMLDAVLRQTSGVRRGGAAALDLCHLACGRLDAFWELWLMPWDVAGGALILREAGGVFAPLGRRGDEEGELARALDGAAAFVGLCDGRTTQDGSARRNAPGDPGGGRRPDGGLSGGAYVAANARLLPALTEVLRTG
ncbi:MAG: inositol monophosphatase family protein [Gemmatimonadota bacterium]